MDDASSFSPPTCPPPAGGMDWVRGQDARPDASETLAYPGIARTDSVNAYDDAIPCNDHRNARPPDCVSLPGMVQ
jgi:hypothetical protein